MALCLRRYVFLSLVIMFNFIKNIFSKKESTKQVKLDYSDIDSREKAIEAVNNGGLYSILMFPEVFGGEDVDENTLYVPPGIPEVQNKIIGTILRFVEEGLVDGMRVIPEYKGKSVIPTKIVIETTTEGKAGKFNQSIDIW